MFINHAPRRANRLAAALRTRESICADAPPGSWVWNQYGCGASASAPAAPVYSAPTPPPAAPTPGYSTPAPPPVAPTIIYDDSAARAAQDAANARIQAEQQAARDAAARAASDEAARLARDEAQRAKAEAAAAADAAMRASGSSGASFSTFAPSSGAMEFDASTLDVSGESKSSTALILAALAAVGLLAMSRKRRR